MKKGLMITAAAVVLTSALSAQAPEIEWQNTIGGNSWDVLSSIRQTTDGGYIIGGHSYSGISGDKTEASLGGYDFWVVKLNSIGEIEWQNSIGGNGSDILNSIQQTTDGGYILGGESDSDISGDKTEASFGERDYWVVKLNSSGVIEWQNIIGGSGSDRLHSIQQTTDGGYILGGWSNSDISGDKTEASLGGDDYWVVKLNSSGTIQWQNTIGGDADDYLYSIQQTADGGYILGGESDSYDSGDKTESYLCNYDYWVVKLNSSGAIEWQNTIAGCGWDRLNSIQQTVDGGYIMCGFSDSDISGDKTEASLGGFDYWIIKLNNTGSIEWQNTIGGNGYDYPESIQQTADEGYILGGVSTSGISGDKTQASLGGEDYWIVKLNNGGGIEWQNTIGGGANDYGTSTQQTSDGGYILGGFSSSGISGNKSENCIGGFDYWVVRLAGTETACAVPTDLESAVLSTKAKVNWESVPEALTYRIRYRSGEAEPWQYKIAYAGKNSIVLKPLLCNTTYEWQIMSICSEVDSLHSEYSSSAWFTTWACRVGDDEDMFMVYPNPTSEIVNIEIAEGAGATGVLSLVNIHGDVIRLQQVHDDEMTWNVSELPAGVYYLRLSTTDTLQIKEILIIQ